MSKIAVLKPEDLIQCQRCESPLHEIADNEFGCDECKDIYYLASRDEFLQASQSLNQNLKRDEHGNPLFPEEIL